MAIHYTCRCGANIRLPTNVAGKKARCNSCGFIFTVPLPELNPEPESESIPLEPGLPEVVRTKKPAPKPEPGLLALDGLEDILAPASVVPEHPREISPGFHDDEDRAGVIEPTDSYLWDLGRSFFFFLDAGSFVTFMFITLLQAIPAVIILRAGFMLAYGVIAGTVISGYLCTFYMAVIKETAGGEDELPNVVPDHPFALVGSFFHFVGSIAWVMLPATAFAIIELANSPQFSLSAFVMGLLFFGVPALPPIHWEVIRILIIVGLFFWPVVILGVSLGGGFSGLWPHTIIRTALAAPLPYLATCIVLLIAAGLAYLPHSTQYQTAVIKLTSKAGLGVSIMAATLGAVMNVYTMIVAMQAIGLYYRHYKHKFPWVAE
jgi:hypothetical protein